MGTYISVELRRRVQNRAGGVCEYCLIPESIAFVPHEIDHVIAQKHGGLTEFENLAVCCAICNKHKGSDLTSIDPETGEITPLYNPRQDRWIEHFMLRGAAILPLTAKGRVTVRLLQFNTTERTEERALLLAADLIIPSRRQQEGSR